jgi:hypothetical protein
MADNAVFGAPPDLGRNLEFLMNLLPMLGRAGNSANPQQVFEEFLQDPSTGSFQAFADQADLPPALGMAMEFLGPDVTGGAGDVARAFGSVNELAPLLGMLSMPPGLRRYWQQAGGEVQDRLFHGTQRTFPNPDERFFRDGNLGVGYYLTRDPDLASDYGLSGEVVGIDEAARPQTRVEFGRFRKPFNTDEALTEQDYDALLGTLSWASPEAGEKLASRIHVGQSRYDTYRDLQEVLGYEGSITNMVLDASGFDGIIADGGREIVAFSPKQVFGGPDGPERLFEAAQREGFQFTPEETSDLERLFGERRQSQNRIVDFALDLVGRGGGGGRQ